MRTAIFCLTMACSAILATKSFAVEPPAPAGKTVLKLVSGDTMTGTVGPVRDGSLSLITEYGPVRIPVEKLSAEAKERLGISTGVDSEALRIRIKELEDLVVRLRDENATLRRGAGTAVQPVAISPSSGARATPTVSPSAVGGSYKISSTGKRHNARCRYFGSAGRIGTASEGVACKICGG